jgi:hypothetical protein
MNRGDVVLARFPHPSGGRGKKRPVVVVQANVYNQTLRTLVVAEVTKNLTMANDPACLFIQAGTPEGQSDRRSPGLGGLLPPDGDHQGRSGGPGHRRPFKRDEAKAQFLPEGRIGPALAEWDLAV